MTVEKLVYGGDGLGRVEGRVVLAPYVLPGEVVNARAEQERSNLLRARVRDIVRPAAERIEPPCPYFGRCGGCHYQHARYEVQLQAKLEILREDLRRLGRIDAPGEIALVAGEPWKYRNRSQFHVRNNAIGYLEPRSHALCPVDHCPISSPKINEALGALRAMARDPRWPRFLRSIELFTNETDVQVNVIQSERPVARRFFDWCAEKVPGYAPGEIEYGGFRVSRNSFFQVNRFLYGQLADAALEEATGETALDLYAGVGLFSVPLAQKFGRVTAVEAGGGAVRDLQFNAERASVSVTAEQAQADAFLTRLESAPDFVLLDPPRAGIGKQVVQQLLRLEPRLVTIVACDPATLARDLSGLLAGGYGIEKMTLVDLFPQTYHIETVVRLRRSK